MVQVQRPHWKPGVPVDLISVTEKASSNILRNKSVGWRYYRLLSFILTWRNSLIAKPLRRPSSSWRENSREQWTQLFFFLRTKTAHKILFHLSCWSQQITCTRNHSGPVMVVSLLVCMSLIELVKFLCWGPRAVPSVRLKYSDSWRGSFCFTSEAALENYSVFCEGHVRKLEPLGY